MVPEYSGIRGWKGVRVVGLGVVAPELLPKRRLSWVAGSRVKSRVMVGRDVDAKMEEDSEEPSSLGSRLR